MRFHPINNYSIQQASKQTNSFYYMQRQPTNLTRQNSMKSTAIFVLGLLLSPADAFVPCIPSTTEQRPNTQLSTTLADFFTTLDTSVVSLTSPGIKEFVLFLTPLSALAGGAVVQQRRKEFVENVEFTKKAMNETQAIMSQSSNNFKVNQASL